MSSEFVQATAFCGRLGEPSYLCLVWSILSEENQYIALPPPPHPPPPKKKMQCRVYGADFWRVVDGET